MKVWYDAEFWERGNGEPIVPISIGLVREDGEELYLVNADAPIHGIANEHPWLRDNVLPHLPVEVRESRSGWSAYWDDTHTAADDVVSLTTLRRVVGDWLTSTPDLELWGWYSAYDHVVLAQLFGTMAEMPKGIPYYTNDVRQLVHRDARVPVQKGDEHHALADARWTRDVHRWWLDLIERGGCPSCGRLHNTWCHPYGGRGAWGDTVEGDIAQVQDCAGDVSP